MRVIISGLCSRAHDGSGYCNLDEDMVDLVEDCEMALESLSFQSLPVQLVQQASGTCYMHLWSPHKKRVVLNVALSVWGGGGGGRVKQLHHTLIGV